VGDEPPIAPLIELLNHDRDIFSETFRDDLKHFIAKFLNTAEDARNSAFWRAVRQEAIYVGEGTTELEGAGGLHLMGSLEDEEMNLYVACDDETVLPNGYSKRPLRTRIGEISSYVVADSADSIHSGIDVVVASVISGELYVPRASRYSNRGVLVFKEAINNEYSLAGGSDANEAPVALVRSDRLDAFQRAYGGEAYPSPRFPDWHEVIDCEVVVRRDLPVGLESVLHLQETMFPPAVRFIGGIRTGQSFHLMPGFMPTIKFKGARTVDLYDSTGAHVPLLTPLTVEGDEWVFVDDDISKLKPGRYDVRVTWRGQSDVVRTTDTELTLIEGWQGQIRHDYKGPGAGRYYLESCNPGEMEIPGDENLPLGILAGELPDGGPDLVDLEPELRYLGPGFGEMSRIRKPGFDWLVTGSNKNPDLLLFIGDTESPQLPLDRRSEVASERRHWRKAINGSRRIAVRLPDGRIVPVDSLPKVHEALLRYKRHNPTAAAPQFRNESWNEASTYWRGEEPDRNVSRFTDALAAISVRRSGVSLKLLIDLLTTMTGQEIGSAPGFVFDIVRGWAESGALDTVYAQGRRASYVVPRRPSFVAYRVATYVQAALVGLVPTTLRAQIERAAVARGLDLDESSAPCRWLPTILRLKCDAPEMLVEISDLFGMMEPHWLEWPIDSTLDSRPDDQSLREGAPNEFFFPMKEWDWSKGYFVRTKTLGENAGTKTGVSVELRSHKERSPIYSVSLDGDVWGWSHIRNWALLFAYTLKDGHTPFLKNGGTTIRRPGQSGIYLPLPLGRLCAILGDGPAGPVLGEGGSCVREYVYPLGRAFLERLSDLLPACRDEEPQASA
jgi:hypothetical protein